MKIAYCLPVLCLAFGSLVEGQQPIPASSQRTFVLPVNWASSPKYSVTVTLPNGFKPLQKEPDLDSLELLEYIPEGQDPNNWTEIISISKYIGKGIPAIKLVDEIKKRILSQASNGKVWLETNSTKPNYQEAAVGLSYDYQGKHEVMEARYFSGPFDCVGIQYTIRPSENQNDDDVSKTIENFIKTNLQAISFTPQ